MRGLAVPSLIILGLVAGGVAQAVTPRTPLSVEWCFTREGGFYQNPYDCHAFVRCDGNVKYEFDCPAGTRWNSAINTCDHIYLTPCNTTQSGQPTGGDPGVSPVYCPPQVADGYQRDPNDCNRYYRCVRGVAHLLKCPQGQVYVSYTQDCGNFEELSPADQGYCSALPPPVTPTTDPNVPFCPPEVADGDQRDSTNCGRYYNCRTGTVSLQPCPQNMYYSPTWGSCVPSSSLTAAEMEFCSGLITVTTPPTPTPTHPPCPQEVVSGTQRDSSNCGRYFQCESGVSTLQACPQDLYYSPAWGVCVPFNTLNQQEKDFCSGITTTPPPTEPPTTPVAPFCPPEVPEGKQRDATDCGRYYKCETGRASLEACVQGLFFSPMWKACVPFNTLSQAEKDFCVTINTREPVCPQNVADGYQRDPQSCTQYVRCVNGQSFDQVCPAGLYFLTQSVSQPPCGRFEDMTATDQGFCAALEADGATTDVPCPVDGFQRDALNCSKYYRCVNGVAYLMHCSGDLYYNTIFQRCSVYTDLTATDKAYCDGLQVATPGPAIQCPANVGFAQFEDPTDCQKYYQCQNGQQREVVCGAGTYYSPQTYRCDLPGQLFRARYDQCLGTPVTTATPSLTGLACGGNNEGLLLDFLDVTCRSYYICRLNQVTSLENRIQCPANMYFNVLRRVCTTFEELPPTFREACQRT